MPPEPPVVLPADVDPIPEITEHPADLTDDEAEAGRRMWLAVDDDDDDSNGLD